MKNSNTGDFIMVKNCSTCPAADWEYYYCNIANYKKENHEYGKVIINSTTIPENCPLKRKRVVLMLCDYLENNPEPFTIEPFDTDFNGPINRD
jgi:hypothetical protein